ncbi:MAG: hypothetical protein R3C59_18610 [Planctomycetaceae bacterium]
MTDSREFQGIRILIPGYSIEDIPSDLNEAPAASLLNAFAVAWHPWLLNASMGLPEARQAEATEMPMGQHVVLVPQCSEDWLAHDWQQQFSDSAHTTLHSCSTRSEWVEQINRHFGAGRSPIDDDLLNHFYALGTCYLQVMLLSRRMHHFIDPDGYLLKSEMFAAAEAAVAGNADSAKDHLRRSFECLLDCREQFHPVDCFLLDICLPSEQSTSTELTALVTKSRALSLIVNGDDLQRHALADESFASSLRTAVTESRLSLLTGHRHELRTSLNSVSAVYADLAANAELLKSLAPDASLHWARRRYGMTSSLPSLLALFEFASALHIVLDDGIYPDREYGYLEWQSGDNTSIPATSRIPMAIDSAASMLKFADRYTESMQQDSTAVLILARLPQLQTPWLQDLQITAEYAPVLGRFVTMTDYIDQCSRHSSPVRFDEGEYLSPYLIQSSVLKTEAPISSPAELHSARGLVDTAAFAECVAAVLKPAQAAASTLSIFEDRLGQEEAKRISMNSPGSESSDSQAARLRDITADITSTAAATAELIYELVPGRESSARGQFLINPLPWSRAVSLIWPNNLKTPASDGSITAAWQQNSALHLQVALPAGGFAWLHEVDSTRSAAKVEKPGGKPLAEPLLLRNQWFEVQFNEKSGGIQGVTFHGQRANRVSQQIAFRFEHSTTITIDDEELITLYATSRMVASRVIESGPFRGRIETTCDVINPVDESVMARYRQTTTVERQSQRLHIRIEFEDLPHQPSGNPWMTYYACRFAWDNEAASIVRSCLGQVAGFRMERFEAPDYIEVADTDHRLLILPHGRPYHRRSGRRMLDSLLIVEGETQRQFDFTLEFDQPFPMRSATEIQQPPLIVNTASQIPAGATSGWILALSAKNIVVARSRVQKDNAPSNDGVGVSVVLLLQETEGRSAGCLIRTARRPKSAHLRHASGTVIRELEVTDDGVRVDFLRLQFKEVELRF